jgi:hypothetical protein
MTTLEQFSLFQRMTGSIKADIEAGKNIQALGKIELLEGELSVMRQGYETEEGTILDNLIDTVEI